VRPLHAAIREVPERDGSVTVSRSRCGIGECAEWIRFDENWNRKGETAALRGHRLRTAGRMIADGSSVLHLPCSSNIWAGSRIN